MHSALPTMATREMDNGVPSYLQGMGGRRFFIVSRGVSLLHRV
jgi:hypothetical protein